MSLKKLCLPDRAMACLFENMANFQGVPILIPDSDRPELVVVEDSHENFQVFLDDFYARRDMMVKSVQSVITHLLDQYQEELLQREKAANSEKKDAK
jgi:hypothetical protein